MSVIDFILNVVGLLLWLNWRAIHLNPVARPGSSLVATLKPAAPPRARWLYLGMLMALLLVRAFIYWQLGPAIQWTPHVPLGPTTLGFRSDLFWQMLFYSAFSFGATLTIVYLWLLVLSCINSHLPENDPQHRFIQLHLGLIEPLPAFLKLLLPFAFTILAWYPLNPLFVTLQMMPNISACHRIAQGAMIGVSVYLTLKYLLIGVLGLHLLNSYVYLGRWSFWNFIDATAQNLLNPLRRLPLTVGRVDLLPIVVLMALLAASSLFSWIAVKFGINISHLFQKLST